MTTHRPEMGVGWCGPSDGRLGDTLKAQPPKKPITLTHFYTTLDVSFLRKLNHLLNLHILQISAPTHSYIAHNEVLISIHVDLASRAIPALQQASVIDDDCFSTTIWNGDGSEALLSQLATSNPSQLLTPLRWKSAAGVKIKPCWLQQTIQSFLHICISICHDVKYVELEIACNPKTLGSDPWFMFSKGSLTIRDPSRCPSFGRPAPKCFSGARSARSSRRSAKEKRSQGASGCSSEDSFSAPNPSEILKQKSKLMIVLHRFSSLLIAFHRSFSRKRSEGFLFVLAASFVS